MAADCARLGAAVSFTSMRHALGRFKSKVAAITGAGSGIGAAIARRLAAEGAAVAVSDCNAAAAAEVANQLRSSGHDAIAFATDVSDEGSVRDLVDQAVDQLGSLDVMVNNAGIGESPTPVDERSSDDWHRVMHVNLDGVFYGVKHAARVMKAHGRDGVIINMASILGVVGFKGAPAYVAAKHAVLGLTKAVALELAPFNIRVLSVNPAFIRTPLITGLEAAVLPLHPIGRLGEPEEVAGLVAYLASSEAAFLTGASYLIDGGYTAA
jgi:NAD(P)-dependent dehydrogenase (short-subunit alcohol dehydrogenase family)